MNFDLAFQFGEGQWRLFGIGVNTSREEPVAAKDAAPAAPGKKPPAGVQKAAAPAQGGAKAVPGEPPPPRPRPSS